MGQSAIASSFASPKSPPPAQSRVLLAIKRRTFSIGDYNEFHLQITTRKLVCARGFVLISPHNPHHTFS